MTTVGADVGSVAGLAENVWVRFAVRRLGRLVVSLWVLVTAAFGMIHLIPGDPVRAALGATAPLSLVNARRAALGLNDPLWTQLPATVELAVAAFLVAVVVSIPLGLLMAVLTRGGRRRRSELAFTSVSVVVAAIPEFLIGVGLVYVFSVHLGWAPVAGRSGVGSYVLPVLVLALGPAAVLARIVRVELLAVLRADYIRTARAKRLPARLVYIFGVGTEGALLAIGFATAPGFARLTQTLVATVADRDYVAAARIAGVGRVRLVVRHVLPNVGEPLVVNATVAAGSALLAFAGLSFLGLGVQPPDYDWGQLLGQGLDGIYVHPAAALAPGVAVVVAGLAFNLFGEAIAKGIGSREPAVRFRRAPATVDSGPSVPDGPVLAVAGLEVGFPTAAGSVTPVRGLSFEVGRGEAVGIVGESGSGKSLTALAVARLVEEPGQVRADRLDFLGATLLGDAAAARRHELGSAFAIVFQDPATSFNPTQRVGRQLAEVARQHQHLGRRGALALAVARLRAVRVPAAARRARQFPHEFSGGMRQRAMIGMGMMGSPALIVADEPTTALDVTVQRQVLRLLAQVRAADDVALLLISHDITVVGQVCDRVLAMYAGRIVEDMPAAELSTQARHPYTRALLAAVPDMATDRERPLAVIPGRPVDPARFPVGCAFAPRCPLADEQCVRADPVLVADAAGRRVACWHADVTAELVTSHE